MTHNEKRQHWLKEGAIGLGTGVLYGITSVAVGGCILVLGVRACIQGSIDQSIKGSSNRSTC